MKALVKRAQALSVATDKLGAVALRCVRLVGWLLQVDPFVGRALADGPDTRPCLQVEDAIAGPGGGSSRPVGETRVLLRVATDDDRVVEGDGSVTATVTAGEGYAPGETLSATVAVEDGVTFAEDRTLALAVAGEVAESDYDLDPSTLVLAAGGSSVQSTFAALADDVDEEVKTAEIAALDPGGNPPADLRPAARAGPRRQRSRARGAASRSETRGRGRGVGDACGTGGGRAEAETPMWTRWDRAGDGENGGQGAELRIGLGERTGNHGDDGPRLPGR